MSYRELLKLLLGKNLPKNLNKNRQLKMMKFESFYHLGLALQNLGKHDQAVKAYTNATDQLDIRKVIFIFFERIVNKVFIRTFPEKL